VIRGYLTNDQAHAVHVVLVVVLTWWLTVLMLVVRRAAPIRLPVCRLCGCRTPNAQFSMRAAAGIHFAAEWACPATGGEERHSHAESLVYMGWYA
jgi:hypothetical protein